MNLLETVELMHSKDFKERFKAEYYQTKYRYLKLHKLVVKIDAGTSEFTPSCPIDLLKKQKVAMGEYLYCLEIRAEIENIELN